MVWSFSNFLLLDHIQEWMSGPLLVVLGVLSLVFLPIWLVGILAPLSLVNFRAYFAPQFDLGRLYLYNEFLLFSFSYFCLSLVFVDICLVLGNLL
jgi:hypothetical protein